MENNNLLDRFSELAGRFTRFFPRGGAKVLDSVFYPLLGNNLLVNAALKGNHRKVKKLQSFRRLLVISDIHIGDAVLLRTAVSALRHFFPDSKIDYMVKKSAACLIEGHPDVSELWPAFTGTQFPNEADVEQVREMSADYDAIFNLCPFLGPESFPEPEKVFHLTSYAWAFIRNEWKKESLNHIAYQAHQFIYELFSPFFPIPRIRSFEGPELVLSPEAIAAAEVFFESKVGKAGKAVVFLNPDTASPYTRIPFSYQSELLNGLVGLDCQVLLGESRADKDFSERLLFTLPIWKRHQVTLVPTDLPLDAYAALIDWSDVFISGDTGPLHLAAAWKRDRSGRHSFRNRTAVSCVFGATPTRLSGYDTYRWDFLGAEQRAPAHVYQSQSSCRNMTCMHKMAKECDASGCFQSLDVDRILGDIRVWLPRTKLDLSRL